MRLTDAQLEQYDRDGFLLFPRLFSPPEIQSFKDEIVRVSAADSECIAREKNGTPRQIFRTHETDGPTASPLFRRLAQSPRFLEPAMQVLGDESLYIFHSKCNVKAAIDGTVWLWHQDYGYWQHDGVREPAMTTFMVMLDAATELGGALYFIPGSHKLGVQPASKDEVTTAYPQWAVEKDVMIEILNRSPQPVAIAGPPGTAALFHCNILHASGHNLAAHDRWHVYMAYNRVANRPNPVPPSPRPDYVVSRNYAPLVLETSDTFAPTASV